MDFAVVLETVSTLVTTTALMVLGLALGMVLGMIIGLILQFDLRLAVRLSFKFFYITSASATREIWTVTQICKAPTGVDRGNPHGGEQTQVRRIFLRGLVLRLGCISCRITTDTHRISSEFPTTHVRWLSISQ